MSNRRKIRENVLQAIYASLVGDHSLEHTLQTIIKPELRDDTKGLAFAESLFLRTMDSREQADEIISRHISNWEINRLALVDRIILEMSIAELMHFDDIPTKVTINEAIDIAKRFSTRESGRFVNGILDAVVASLREDNMLNKKGRGLVDLPAQKSRSEPKYSEDGDAGDPADGSDNMADDISSGKAHQPIRASSKKQRIKRSRTSGNKSNNL